MTNPLFDTVEVEVNVRCNRKCSYCPVSILPLPDNVPMNMPDEVFGKILSELKRLDFKGRFSYHFYNEPLLRKDLERLVAWTKQEIPEAYQVLFTNGDALTDKRHESLVEAGVDYFLITSHSGKAHPDRPKQLLQYPADLVMTNRGGLMTNLPTPTQELLSKPCYAPSELLVITVAGDVVLCCEDAKRENVFGNVMQQPLDVIWHSPSLSRIRAKLEAGNRHHGICATCSSASYTSPGRAAFTEPTWQAVEEIAPVYSPIELRF